jgi:hypothetical protein
MLLIVITAFFYYSIVEHTQTLFVKRTIISFPLIECLFSAGLFFSP